MRQLDIVQHDVVLQGRIAVKHVHELTGILAHGLHGKRNLHIVKPIGFLADPLDPADNLRADKIVVNCGERHFDALLVGNSPRTCLDGARIAMNAIDCLDPCHDQRRGDGRMRTDKFR